MPEGENAKTKTPRELMTALLREATTTQCDLCIEKLEAPILALMDLGLRAQRIREEDCREICPFCRKDIPLNGYWHVDATGAIGVCRATPIRELQRKEQG